MHSSGTKFHCSPLQLFKVNCFQSLGKENIQNSHKTNLTHHNMTPVSTVKNSCAKYNKNNVAMTMEIYLYVTVIIICNINKEIHTSYCNTFLWTRGHTLL